MSQHIATIQWKRHQAKFIDRQYSRDHHWQFDGGVEVAASASPDVVRVPYSNPACVDPEEAFVAALSSCHMLWFLDLAAHQKFVVESYTDSAVGIVEHNPEGKLAIAKIILRPEIIFVGDNIPTDAQIQLIHEETHHSCFLANSVKIEIIIETIASKSVSSEIPRSPAKLNHDNTFNL
jgi:organic hydroperoxide reductase OsmC/OhrA